MLGKKGFTLIELLVVIIIVGVLAAVSVPMMRGNIDRAKKTEAVAALGSIRTAERLYFAEKANYVNVPAANFASGSHALNAYLKAGDLDGRYFRDECYSVTSASTTGFNAVCNANQSGIADSNTLGTIYMLQNGYIGGY